MRLFNKRLRAPAKSGSLTVQPEAKSVEAVASKIEANRRQPGFGLVEVTAYLLTPLALIQWLNTLTGHVDAWEIGVSIGIIIAAIRFATLRRDLAIAQAAAQAPGIDKSVVSPLIALATSQRPYLRTMARYHLRRVLCEITLDDAHLLLPGDLAGLAQMLGNIVHDPELTAAILHACGELGDPETHPWLVYLAASRAFTPAQARTRKLARIALYKLEERLAGTGAMAAQPEAVEDLTAVQQQTETAGYAVETLEERREAERAIADLGLDKLGNPSLRMPFYIAAWIVIIPYALTMTIRSLMNQDWVPAMLFAAAGALATQLRRFVMTSQHLMVVGRLAGIQDPRIVGQLASALDWPNQSVRTIAMEALTHHLPKLKASDSALLNAAQRASIYRMLKMSNATTHFSFIMATLAALEQIGDQAAVPYVLELAESVPASGTQRKICAAARRCMPFLEVRAGQTSMSQTLLRGSSLTPTGPEALLRPSARSSEEGAEVLLRPGA